MNKISASYFHAIFSFDHKLFNISSGYSKWFFENALLNGLGTKCTGLNLPYHTQMERKCWYSSQRDVIQQNLEMWMVYMTLEEENLHNTWYGMIFSPISITIGPKTFGILPADREYKLNDNNYFSKLTLSIQHG